MYCVPCIPIKEDVELKSTRHEEETHEAGEADGTVKKASTLLWRERDALLGTSHRTCFPSASVRMASPGQCSLCAVLPRMT